MSVRLLIAFCLGLLLAAACGPTANDTASRDREAEVRELSTRVEALVAECSRTRIQRDEQKRRADTAEAALAGMKPRLERALADLERITAECEEHLEARIRLERRVEDLLAHLGKGD